MNRKLDIYADGIPPDPAYISKIIKEYNVCGFTCNPTLIKQYLPITYYEYCKVILDNSQNFPVSIQVLSSDLSEMIKDAKIISSWGKNVYVKIPIINEFNEDCISIITHLLKNNIKVNITAIFNYYQIASLLTYIPNSNYILSIFSGRIADLGKIPNDIIKDIYRTRNLLIKSKKGKILWAGSRQILDIFNAKKYCDIITLPKSILDKMNCLEKTSDQYCLETVQMFAKDSKNFNL